MATFRLEHPIRCDVETFWSIFFDPALNRAIYRHGLEFPSMEIVSFEQTDARVTRKVTGVPKMKGLPGPVVKLLGDFSYVENGQMDRAEGIWRFEMIPNRLADKLHQSGTVRVTDKGDGTVLRQVDVKIEAKVFGIGGLVESAAEKIVREAWETSAVYMNGWIDGKYRDLVE